MPVNTVAVPQTEYLVLTKCGRRFSWSSPNMESLFRELQFRGYEATFVQPMTEYEAKEQQEDLMHEFRVELERELKESA